jgi:hypothetical protein
VDPVQPRRPRLPRLRVAHLAADRRRHDRRPDARESGFWRPRGEDDVELLVANPDGLVEIYVGTARTTTSWELHTDVLARTPDAPDVTRAVRLYGIVDGALMYAIDRAGADEPLRPLMSARLERIR